MTIGATPAGSLPAGADLVVRSIRPDDAPALHAFHQRLSPDTVRRRFFAVHPDLTDAEARRFTAVGSGREAAQEVALVATVDELIVGVGRYVRIHMGEVAEVAFVVEDRYQGRGIATELLSLLARIAWDDGIRRFVADTFADNHAMLAVFGRTPRAVVIQTTRRDGSVVHLTMALAPPHSDLTLVG
ncbi:MAG: GNAT family N-acetyltransferase [Candidatus Dormibacteraeota bacterium]|nr:GNAT family N-acetyltransferase [Candidatus Dormibacteraeota bacterium]